MTAGSTDRRVRRTVGALHLALQELMSEKGYDKVSVQEIIDRADVGRSTFYSHFTDKEDLLASSIGQLRGQLVAEGLATSDPLGFSLVLFRHICDGRDLYRTLVSRGGAPVVLRLFTEMVEEVLGAALAGLSPTRGTPPPPEITANFLAGAQIRLLTAALDRRPPTAPEELDAAYRALAEATLSPWYDLDLDIGDAVPGDEPAPSGPVDRTRTGGGGRLSG